MDYTALSKEVSYALRHAPWEYELEMDGETARAYLFIMAMKRYG